MSPQSEVIRAIVSEDSPCCAGRAESLHRSRRDSAAASFGSFCKTIPKVSKVGVFEVFTAIFLKWNYMQVSGEM